MSYKTITLKVKHEDLVKDFPNFSKTGSIQGMKKLFYGENAMLVKCGSYIYNVPQDVYKKALEL